MDITILLSVIFLCGHTCIVLESYDKMSKAAVTLITAVFRL